jgi:type II secretory pathway pseudopilin PulG
MFTGSINITLVLGRITYKNPGVDTDMQEKQTAMIFIEMFAVVAILGVLSAIAIPHAGQMVYKSKAEARQIELQNIQTAVTEMLYDSNSGALESIGPINDLKQVKTKDPQPLILNDYILGGGGTVRSGCYYLFTTDGIVMQMMP